MKYSLVIALLTAASCNKDKEEEWFYPLSFQLFLFDQNGNDLVNPANPNCINADDIDIITQYQDINATWEIYKSWEAYDTLNESTIVYLSGFHYFKASTGDIWLSPELKNASLKSIVKIKGHADNEIVFKFGKNGAVSTIYVNGARIQEETPYPYYYNVKLVI